MAETRFHHISLTCQDPIAVERYYTKHFGFRRVRVVPIGDTQIVFIRNGNFLFELFQATQENPLQPPKNDGYPWPGVRNFSFEVDDVDAKLREMGNDARVQFGPMSFDDFIPGWRSAWLVDPGGNLVQITQGYVDQESPPPLPQQ
jgi:glyoxylase I family protein